MAKVGMIVVGVALAALCALWFFTPLGAEVAGYFGQQQATRDFGGNPQALDLLNTGLNALNAFFGAVGVFLTIKGLRRPA